MLTCQIPYRAVVAEPFQFFFLHGSRFHGGNILCVCIFSIYGNVYIYVWMSVCTHIYIYINIYIFLEISFQANRI